jgi:hypothetical protein
MGKRLLLVEGKDDQHVIRHLLRAHGVSDGLINVVTPVLNSDTDPDFGGKHALLESIPVRLNESDLERLGVVLDADESLGGTWSSLRGRLTRSGIDLPDIPDPNGTICNTTDVRFGVWLMPDNRVPGILESFLAFLIPPDDNLLPRVDSFIDSIPEHERRFSNRSAPKARIHSWLALQQRPGKPLGLSITHKFLDGNAQATKVFVSWIKQLLVE